MNGNSGPSRQFWNECPNSCQLTASQEIRSLTNSGPQSMPPHESGGHDIDISQ